VSAGAGLRPGCSVPYAGWRCSTPGMIWTLAAA
jgi:hypothetical protein